MKKIIISAVLGILITMSSFATDAGNISSNAVTNFSKDFDAAKNVTWTSTDHFIKASFVLDNKNMEAYYDLEGNRIGNITSISPDELPVRAKRSFAKKYSDYTVKDAILFMATDETAYFLSVENEIQSLILKVSAEGFVSVYKKAKK